MKSGTNQYHGTGYEYFVNEALNAGQPFGLSDQGHKFDPRNRRNDFGGTLGGPIYIPKVYDGHNRSFFFWSYEEFRESSLLNPGQTLPVAAYRNGDFSSISVNGGANFNPNLGVVTTALPSRGRPGPPDLCKYDLRSGHAHESIRQRRRLSQTRFRAIKSTPPVLTRPRSRFRT